jgi:16S rRNA (cytosine1402-N4)-methyltransferase
MLNEVLDWLIVDDAGIYLDATIGGGGHADAILNKFPHLKLIGMDQDRDAINHVAKRLVKFSSRLELLQGNFRSIDQSVFENNKWNQKVRLSGALYDLGVSSYQIDNPERGFSFMHPTAELDMRMTQEGTTAAEWLEKVQPRNLKDILVEYGDLRKSDALVKQITASRGRLRTAGDLCRLIDRAIPPNANPIKIYAKVFQAIRIFLNDELGALEESILRVQSLLDENSRFVFISYHKGEFITIKNTMQGLGFELLTKKPLTSNMAEYKINPRSRSAKLLAYRKVQDAL